MITLIGKEKPFDKNPMNCHNNKKKSKKTQNKKKPSTTCQRIFTKN